MRIRWWQSIRWRLALGSVLLALLTTSSLALTAIIITNNYYGTEQEKSLSDFATIRAQRIGEVYVGTAASTSLLHKVANQVISSDSSGLDGQQLLTIVFGRAGLPVYPDFPNVNIQLSVSGQHITAANQTIVAQGRATVAEAQTIVGTQAGVHAQAQVKAARTAAAAARVAIATAQSVTNAKAQQNKRATRDAVLYGALRLINPSLQQSDFKKFQQDLIQAFSRNHTQIDGEFGRYGPVSNVQPFSIRPIFAGTSFIGVLAVVMHENKIPPFVLTVGEAVLVGSFIIALIAALAAILFSQTITSPLLKLRDATRVLASGNYDARVTTEAPGEMGELAHNFNEMAEELKQDVEELQKQELWRRELIMSITHDLATPLTAIAGLGEALLDGVNQSREDYEVTGRVIVRETLRLRRLVKDLHVMAKLEAGAFEPQCKAVRLASLVDESLAVLAPEFERLHVEPINAIAYNLPQIQADPDMLTRVFSNLCDNALRHTPSEGKVTIDAVIREDMLLVSVADTGEGIPEEALARVFERFYRADSARQSTTGGSGLGLAIVRAIIEAHEGTVWAENAPGGGARICFTLSRREQSAAITQPIIKGVRGSRLVKLEEKK